MNSFLWFFPLPVCNIPRCSCHGALTWSNETSHSNCDKLLYITDIPPLVNGFCKNSESRAIHQSDKLLLVWKYKCNYWQKSSTVTTPIKHCKSEWRSLVKFLEISRNTDLSQLILLVNLSQNVRSSQRVALWDTVFCSVLFVLHILINV